MTSQYLYGGEERSVAKLREGGGTSMEEGTATIEGLPKLEMRDLPSFIIDKESREA
ncbi:hypothetical protein QQ045_026242 [Rhodiola kirilowii]